MKSKSFTLDYKSVWFVLHFTGEKLTALEEHDWREGGYLPGKHDDWSDEFIKVHVQRIHVENSKQRAEAFLEQCRKTIRESA